MIEKRRPVVVDLFSGAGGFSRGFHQEGLPISLAVEIDHDAARTYSANFPNAIVLEEDIREITSREIKDIVGREVDILIGSPPCEAFTSANPNRIDEPVRRLYDDPRGSLTLEFIRLVNQLRPKIFVMENVQGLINSSVLREAVEYEFRRVGYEPFLNLLFAEDYGNPSHRSRVFISNIPLRPKKYRRRVTVWEAIWDLQDKLNLFPNHETTELNERKLVEISKLGYEEYLSMYEGAKGQRIPLYMRLNPDELAPTVMGASKFVHPYENRFLTVREQARLMSYPDEHYFYGSRDSQYNQVGESVPVTLSRAIAKEVRRSLWLEL